MGRVRWYVWVVVAILAMPLQPLRAQSCAGPWIDVSGTDSAETLELVCDSAAEALAFLAPFTLVPNRMIRIELVQHPLMDRLHPLYGSYDPAEDRVRVMSQRAIRAQPDLPQVYGQPFDRLHYRGIIAHEVAHAVVQQHAPELNHTAQEYLAHATQLAVQPVGRRQQIIDRANVEPWQLDDVISDIYMAMGLSRFAVKCYLHLTKHAQPVQLVQMLLQSKWRFIVVEL